MKSCRSRVVCIPSCMNCSSASYAQADSLITRFSSCENSAGLDAESEKLVFEALDRLMEGKTSIVIAHRLSTIRSANIIYVVSDGQIVERGKHEELSKSRGLYSELYELQFRELCAG